MTTDSEAVAATLHDHIRELHKCRTEQVITGSCAAGECDHEYECPTVPFEVCAECWRISEEADAYFVERSIESAAYPCRTIKALDGWDDK